MPWGIYRSDSRGLSGHVSRVCNELPMYDRVPGSHEGNGPVDWPNG